MKNCSIQWGFVISDVRYSRVRLYYQIEELRLPDMEYYLIAEDFQVIYEKRVPVFDHDMKT